MKGDSSVRRNRGFPNSRSEIARAIRSGQTEDTMTSYGWTVVKNFRNVNSPELVDFLVVVAAYSTEIPPRENREWGKGDLSTFLDGLSIMGTSPSRPIF